MKLKEESSTIDEEIKLRKKLKTTLESRILDNDLKIKELENQNV